MSNVLPQGALLRELRLRLGGLSQEKLASRLGVSWSSVSRWENGKGSPSPLARKRIEALLKKVRLHGQLSELGSRQ